MLEKQHLLGELPDDPRAAANIIEQFSDEVFGNLYIHRCLISSCGKPPGGKCGCRFALPRAAGEYYSETRPYFFVARKGTGNRYTIEVYKSEEESDRHEESVACILVVWELKRPDSRDGRVVEGNKLMAYLFASNTNVQHLGGEDVLIAVAKYVVGFCSKNPVQVANIMSTIRQVSREVKEMERGASNTKDETTFLLKRIINSLDTKVEFSAQMAAISLLGYPSWHGLPYSILGGSLLHCQLCSPTWKALSQMIPLCAVMTSTRRMAPIVTNQMSLPTMKPTPMSFMTIAWPKSY